VKITQENASEKKGNCKTRRVAGTRFAPKGSRKEKIRLSVGGVWCGDKTQGDRKQNKIGLKKEMTRKSDKKETLIPNVAEPRPDSIKQAKKRIPASFRDAAGHQTTVTRVDARWGATKRVEKSKDHQKKELR